MTIASGTGPSSLATQGMARVSFADPTAQRGAARHAIAITGTVVVLAGFVTQVIAITTATWWHATVAGQRVSLGFADFGPKSWRGFAFMYFSWGAWLIAGLTLGFGVAGCVRWRGAHAFRIVGSVFAVVATVAPIAALLTFAYQSQSDLFHVVRDYTLGPYLAVLGTLATAFGIVAGSAR